MAVGIQLELLPSDHRIKGIDRDAVALTECLDRQQFFGILIDRMAGDAADIGFGQQLKQFVQ